MISKEKYICRVDSGFPRICILRNCSENNYLHSDTKNISDLFLCCYSMQMNQNFNLICLSSFNDLSHSIIFIFTFLCSYLCGPKKTQCCCFMNIFIKRFSFNDRMLIFRKNNLNFSIQLHTYFC